MSVELFWPAYEPFNETKTPYSFLHKKFGFRLKVVFPGFIYSKDTQNIKVLFPLPTKVASYTVSAQKDCSVIKEPQLIRSRYIVSVEFSVASCYQCFGSITIASTCNLR